MLSMKIVSLNRVWLVFVCILAASCIANVQDGGRDTAINEDGRNDEWGYVGYGGGGAMFHPQVSPHDPKTVLVACDMTGSYITSNGGDSWRMFNLKAPVDYFVYLCKLHRPIPQHGCRGNVEYLLSRCTRSGGHCIEGRPCQRSACHQRQHPKGCSGICN